MSHSRFKNRQQQEDRFTQNRNPQRYTEEHSGQDRPYSRSWDYGPQYSEEQERWGRQSGYEGGYGGSQGSYGRQGGYQQNNYVPGSHEESDFSFGSDYIRDQRAYRPSRMSRQSGNRSWVNVGDSSYSGDTGGRSYSSDEYNENPSYMEGRSESMYGGTPDDMSRFDYRRLQRLGAFGTSGARTSFAGRGPQGYKRSDERIIEDINEHLTSDHDVDASNIRVECKDGEVTLKGTVTDRQAKRRAEDIADRCSGVKDVQNQLRIQQEEGSGSSYEDRKSEEKRSKAS